jgi:hypothetical protein
MGPAAESRARDENPSDLDIAQDLRFLRRDWRAHRVGWAAIACVVVLAVAGGLGRGVLASSERVRGDVTVRYDRVARHEARTLVEVVVPAHAREVWMEQALHERWRVEHVVPEPTRVGVDGDRVRYHFDVGARGGAVRFDLKPEKNGRARGRIGVDDKDGVPVEQWVLP